MTRPLTLALLLSSVAILITAPLLIGCGSTTGQSTASVFAFESSSTTDPLRAGGTKGLTTPLRAGATKGLWQTESNPEAYDPMTDLPSNGTSGIRVERPSGAKVNINGEYADLLSLVEAAEPVLLSDPENVAAWTRLVHFEELLIKAVRTGYKQWARHLRPQTLNVDLQIGGSVIANCGGGHNTIGCYLPGTSKVILTEDWMLEQYRKWRIAAAYRRGNIETDVFFDVLHLVTHEAGHQFGYRHPQGTTDGCGDGITHCHAPYGSGSVLSYDHLFYSPTRYAPTKEDVNHIKDGRWNGDPVDRYTVTKTSVAQSITSYGFWLDHEFYVTGWTGFGSVTGGNGSVRNEMMVQPFVNGTPSASHGLSGNATWSGDFLGYDLRPSEMAALTADANLTYTFASETMKAHFSDFMLWRGDDPISAERGNYTYIMGCDTELCFEYVPRDRLITTEFYSDGGDPSGYAAGVVNDYKREYAGAFGAKRQ